MPGGSVRLPKNLLPASSRNAFSWVIGADGSVCPQKAVVFYLKVSEKLNWLLKISAPVQLEPSRTGALIIRLLFQFVVHNVLENSGERIERHGAEVAVRAVARGDGAGFDVAVADDEHVGDLLHLRVADLLADLLAAGIDGHAAALRGDPCSSQQRGP